MAVAVLMPKQGQSVETCIITQWFKKKGESVKTGDLLFSYETDKASFEEEAKTDGILLDVFYNDGDEVPVLVNIAVIGQAGESVEAFRQSAASQPAAQAEPVANEQVVETVVKTPEPKVVVAQSESSSNVGISPRAKNTAQNKGVDVSSVSGSGPGGRIIERDILAAAQNKPVMSPLAAQIAAEKQLSASTGSGVGGRALASDLSINPVYGAGDFVEAKLSNMRKIIAKAMHESLQNSAQLTHHMSADVRKLQAFRNQVKAAVDKGYPVNITLNDMVCFCVIRALKKMPEVNSQFMGDTIRTFNKVHLGLAVDTPRGLMVPTVKNADDLSLTGLASQLKSVADACKKGSVDPALLQSSAASFTVSNLGNYGVELFTPVINLPQVAILGVNTIIPRPADLGGGVFGFVPFIGLSLTYDHRALDGGPATLFLREIKNEIENWNQQLG